jgi:hypothetical protein
VFYHLDRQNRLVEGQTLELIHYNNVSPSKLQNHVDSLFQRGVSNFGERYFLNPTSKPFGIDWDNRRIIEENAIEILFEYVRRSHFSTMPSRFESIFAFESVENANKFITKFVKNPSNRGTLWEVEGNDYVKLDMNFLSLGNSILCASYNAHKYWRGEESGSEQTWEILLKPPVKVIQRVQL